MIVQCGYKNKLTAVKKSDILINAAKAVRRPNVSADSLRFIRFVINITEIVP